MRTILGKPISITSALRCAPHNASVGGSRASQHMRGTAADIKVTNHTGQALAAIAERVPQFKEGGIGVYEWGIHLDVRGGRARWKISN